MNVYKRGTVGWLIQELEKLDKNMTVLSGGPGGWWYALRELKIRNIIDGEENQNKRKMKSENDCVCIENY